MLEVQAKTRARVGPHQIVFVIAMTHATIQACLSKLQKIIDRYRQVPDLSLEWLEDLQLEHVLTGSAHSKPKIPSAQKSHADDVPKPRTWIYAGTVYQLYAFGKWLERGVDCIVIDEAGQLGLFAASLVLRALSNTNGIWGGKIVIAGDRATCTDFLWSISRLRIRSTTVVWQHFGYFDGSE
ncbi:hypothetical protein K439DRAFT_1153217 [Ramaria rubella]|nr:hypothetical protein K439DRAFT_1153217 [Ramaria rubella]